MITLVHPAQGMPKRHQRAVKFYTADIMMPNGDIHIVTFDAESFVLGAGFAVLAAQEKGGQAVSMDEHESEAAREFFLTAVL